MGKKEKRYRSWIAEMIRSSSAFGGGSDFGVVVSAVARRFDDTYVWMQKCMSQTQTSFYPHRFTGDAPLMVRWTWIGEEQWPAQKQLISGKTLCL